MEKNRESQVSSPVATVEDIQIRLLRPPHRSQQPSSTFIASQKRDLKISQISSDFAENSNDLLLKEKEMKKREVEKVRRLEDYLDPILLSTIRAKVSSKRRNNFAYGAEVEKKSSSKFEQIYEFDMFEWHEKDGDPHELKAFTDGASRVEPAERNDVVDLCID